jgi:glycosyltransferase involved in cell wall biosynthesis
LTRHETGAPEIAVVVASHDRPLRLRWLLNALEEQTLDRGRFEVVVGHDSSHPETEELLRAHPLAESGTLRHVTLPAGSAPPGRNRNAAWKEARAPLIAFTDDDCRPPPEWLARALEAARAHPDAIVQGATMPDPRESRMLLAPHWRSQMIVPPTPWAQACNIVYPRAVLERAGGFDEGLHSGEDTDLALRARATGTPYVGVRELLTYHAVDARGLIGRLRSLSKWLDAPAVVKRHPELRRDFPLWLFWKRTHVWLPLAVAGAALERRNPLFALLAIPWVTHTLPQQHGTHPRGRYRALSELPGRAVIDLAEFAVLVRGSVRHRSLLL